MQIELIAEQEVLAQRGAELIAQAARDSIGKRGKFLFAVSGGAAPWIMFEALSKQRVEWDKVHLFQVDERAAPDDDDDRNYKHLRETLIDRVPLPAGHAHPMPVHKNRSGRGRRPVRGRAAASGRDESGVGSRPPGARP